MQSEGLRAAREALGGKYCVLTWPGPDRAWMFLLAKRTSPRTSRHLCIISASLLPEIRQTSSALGQNWPVGDTTCPSCLQKHLLKSPFCSSRILWTFSFARSSEHSGIKAGVDCVLLFLQARVEANSVKLTFTFEGKNLPSFFPPPCAALPFLALHLGLPFWT